MKGLSLNMKAIMFLRFKMEQERKEMEARNAERERHEREKQERERHEIMVNENRPASRESYHGHPRVPSGGGSLRTMDRPPDGRPPGNHMEAPPGYAYPSYMPYQGPPRSEAGPTAMVHRPPSGDPKAHEIQERRLDYQKSSLKKDVPPTKPAPGSGGGGGAGGGSSGPPNTFTAATLIDAIIIHQINNGSNSEDEKGAANSGKEPPTISDQGSKYLVPGVSPSSTQHSKVHRGQPSPLGAAQLGPQVPHGSLPQSQPHPSLQYPHQSPHQSRQPSPKADPAKDQRSPPYKPHKTIAKSLDSREAPVHPESQQQQLQHEHTSSSTAPHLGVSSSADVERSQEGMCSAEKAAQNAASMRAITLGEHIDAIIIQDYTQKNGPSPNGVPVPTESPSKFLIPFSLR